MKHLRLITSIWLSLFLITAPTYAESDGTSLEFRIKAVCLFNFAKYVRWPEKVFQTKTQPIRVCILGDSPFGDVFQSNDAPKEAQDRPLNVVNLPRTASKDDILSCQMLYWQEKNESVVQALMPALQAHSVLTVADKDSKQSIVSFTLDDGKVRFRIRRDIADSMGLSISSQLLKLAILDE